MRRPVGITFVPDGTLFVSDDKTGEIYHIWYQA
jgi:glucose/arabinose dehydrogenase